MAKIHVSIDEKIGLESHDKTRLKYRDGGTKVIRELTEGEDFHAKTRKWNTIYRLIDWCNNLYRETFWDKETGQIIRHCEEPLSEHRGHGSDKKNQPK